MKPVERAAALAQNTARPIMVLAADGDGTAEPSTYTVERAEFGRLLALIGEGAWAAALIERLWAEAEEAARFAKAQRDDSYPKADVAIGEEPGEPHPWSQGFWEGAAHVRSMLADVLHTDPERFTGPDNPYAVGPRTVGVGVAKATILEFDPDPEPGPAE